MRLALRDKAATPFRVPRAIELMPIDAKSGKRAIFGEEGVILEAFKPGDEPPDSTKVIGEGGVETAEAAKPGEGVVLVPAQPQQPGMQPQQPVAQPEAGGGLTTQGGGLY